MNTTDKLLHELTKEELINLYGGKVEIVYIYVNGKSTRVYVNSNSSS